MFSSGRFPFATFILSHFVKTKVIGIYNSQKFLQYLDLFQYLDNVTLGLYIKHHTLLRPSQFAQSKSTFWGGTLASMRSKTATRVLLFKKYPFVNEDQSVFAASGALAKLHKKQYFTSS